MKKLYKARLTKLLDFLAHVPDERFDLSHWRNNSKDDRPSYYAVDDDALRTGCGTTGCAVGWACTIPEFKEAGLSYVNSTINYGSLKSFQAVAEFFGVSYTEAVYLFSQVSYKVNASPYDVAERLYKVAGVA